MHNKMYYIVHKGYWTPQDFRAIVFTSLFFSTYYKINTELSNSISIVCKIKYTK